MWSPIIWEIENREWKNGIRKPDLITTLSIAGCRFRIGETKSNKQSTIEINQAIRQFVKFGN